jgi:hypothetical protein
MSIYIDLDETLIHAKYATSGNSGKRSRIKIPDQDGAGYELYYSLLRPKALELLEVCRALSDVKMLTTATRDYAQIHNETFKLGFSERNIIAREDYLVNTTIAFGLATKPAKYRTDPQSVLIDNLPRLATAAMLKQQFLGLNPANYIQIREFDGKDPEIFANELNEILEKVKNWANKTHKNPPNHGLKNRENTPLIA